MYDIGALTVKASNLVVLAVFLTGAGMVLDRPAAQVSPMVTFEDDQVGTIPEGFQCGMTGHWKTTVWSVQDFQGLRVFGHFGFWGRIQTASFRSAGSGIRRRRI
jgi:hypothetical protein